MVSYKGCRFFRIGDRLWLVIVICGFEHVIVNNTRRASRDRFGGGSHVTDNEVLHVRRMNI